MSEASDETILFQEGDLVWVRWERFPLWPSVILITANKYHEGKVAVYVYGTGKIYWVSESCVIRYTKEDILPKTKGQSASYKRAILEFQEEINLRAEKATLTDSGFSTCELHTESLGLSKVSRTTSYKSGDFSTSETQIDGPSLITKQASTELVSGFISNDSKLFNDLVKKSAEETLKQIELPIRKFLRDLFTNGNIWQDSARSDNCQDVYIDDDFCQGISQNVAANIDLVSANDYELFVDAHSLTMNHEVKNEVDKTFGSQQKSAFTFPKIAFDGGETPVTDSDVDMTFAETVLLLGETLIEDDEIVDRTVVTDS